MKGWDHVTHLSELEKRCTSLWFKVNPANVVGPITGLLVGECPGTNTRPTLPLYPYPPNSSGGRLMKMSLLPVETYLGKLLRQNLFYEHQEVWDEDKAIDNAVEIVQARKAERVVLCGKKVAMAFGFRKFFHLHVQDGVWYTAIPHPSGLNLAYNSPATRELAGKAIRFAAGQEIEQ